MAESRDRLGIGAPRRGAVCAHHATTVRHIQPAPGRLGHLGRRSRFNLSGSGAGEVVGPSWVARESCLGCGPRRRNTDTHLKTGTGIAGCDFATMQQDRPTGNGQSQTDSSAGAVSRFIRAKKRIKDAREQVFGNARTMVADADPDPTVTVIHSHDYARLSWGEPDRVAQNVFYGAT